jgi:hypothetical protein
MADKTEQFKRQERERLVKEATGYLDEIDQALNDNDSNFPVRRVHRSRGGRLATPGRTARERASSKHL